MGTSPSDCGACRWWVLFVLAVDPRGRTRFAPLGGETLLGRVPEADRGACPTASVMFIPEAQLLTRSRLDR